MSSSVLPRTSFDLNLFLHPHAHLPTPSGQFANWHKVAAQHPKCPIVPLVETHLMDFHNTSLDAYEAQQAADDRNRQSLNTDTCWDDFGFREFWDEVELLNDLPVDLEHGWALEEILAAYKAENTAQDAVAAIADGYDPTPQTAYEFFH